MYRSIGILRFLTALPIAASNAARSSGEYSGQRDKFKRERACSTSRKMSQEMGATRLYQGQSVSSE